MKKTNFFLLLLIFITIFLVFQQNIIAKTLYAIKDADGNIIGVTDMNILPGDMIEKGCTLEYLSGDKPKKDSAQEPQEAFSNSEEINPESNFIQQEKSGTSPSAISTQASIQEPDEVIQIIRKNAREKWGNDEEMFNYEVKNQTTAYNWYKSENKYPDILKNAKAKWQNDYEMVKYTYENQIEAYEWLQNNKNKNPEAFKFASDKWQDDYEMVKYEYENIIK
jgi:hypothetical protein